MTLTATIIAIESGERFRDGKRRVTLCFQGCDMLHNEIKLANESYVLGERVEFVDSDLLSEAAVEISNLDGPTNVVVGRIRAAMRGVVA